MTATGTIATADFDRWHWLARRFLDYGYRQCWLYAQALALRHRTACEHVVIESEGEVLGLASVQVRTAPLMRCGVADIAGGPLTRMGRDGDIDRLAECLELLRAEYVERRGLVLRILAAPGSPDWNIKVTAALSEAGMVPADPPPERRTILLDVSRPPAAIRKECSKNWRRSLRRAERASFAVRTGTTEEIFDPLRSLCERLRGRMRLEGALDADFYAALQGRLAPGERFTAGLVELDGEPVAGLVCSMLGDTGVPLLLAADESEPVRDAVFLLQWRSIVTAHERGMRYYDLGGIDPRANVGVYNFQKGLRGLDLTAPGCCESVPSIVKGATRDIFRQAADSVPGGDGQRRAA